MQQRTQLPSPQRRLVAIGLFMAGLGLAMVTFTLLSKGGQSLAISHLAMALSGVFLVLLGLVRPWLAISDPLLLVVAFLVCVAALAQWFVGLSIYWAADGAGPSLEMRTAVRNIALSNAALVVAGMLLMVFRVRSRPAV